ncbi:pyridine nucleotide-disulfide oxidoreductase [Qipengyuania flava]|uniref:FAD-dependent oxidoreductase n=1 Tax=Qipengyuania flava TaxID=192812 RepID=UPI000B8C27D5|nr:FAD-dependent oxidoreductase [Qipengyuania flava]ASP30045.1 pyridine nucleotide-disulfide oxidoreductase [Qipengyuania flava]
MRHIAIVGSGPAGYYTAEAAVKQWGEDARVDIFDKLPVPFGLIRTGVAPDHQSIKAVARRYEKTAIGDTVRFAGNVEIGRDIAIEELTELYDAVILATGAPRDRDLPIPGANSANVFGSAAFVGWYNGHPEYAALAPDLSGRHAVIIGMGNVALDVARILSKTEAEFEGSDVVAHALELLRDSNIETITILGRRGPHQIMMTPKELGELLRLERAVPRVENADLPPPESDDMLDPGQRKSVTLLREFAALSPSHRAGKALSINFDFFASPTLIEQEGGNLSGLVVERTELKDGRAVGSGETYRIPADLLISCIGYRTSPIAGVPFDERAGRFPNEEGRIAPALYCVGWAKRGPSGTIGTNRPDGYAVIEKVADDIGEGAGKRGREGFDELAQKRALDVVTFRDWQRIEEAEIAAARSGAPREKFVDIESMIAARGA